MIPIQDNIPARRYPLMMLTIIVATVAAFIYQLSLPPGALKAFVFQYGVIPDDFAERGGLIAGLVRGESVPLFTSMFLHGGWLHLIGNMWYLWIFGDNIEDRMGHFRFLLFYLAAGIAASFTHIIMNPNATLPAVGASGAIAGVLGAYLVTFPLARVVTMLPIFVFIQFIELPAILVLGFWFLIQLFSGTAAITTAVEQARETGGVAYWAHIGGFVFGMVFGRMMMRGVKQAPERWEPRRRDGGWLGRNPVYSRKLNW